MGTCGIFVSITSIIALILAFVTQQHIIYLQKFELQRTSIRDSVIRLESKFFHLLELFNNTIEGLELVEDKITYHAMDAGNYLWGYAMREMWIPLGDALIGAQFNNIRSEYYPGITFDDKYDQVAIIEGWLGRNRR